MSGVSGLIFTISAAKLTPPVGPRGPATALDKRLRINQFPDKNLDESNSRSRQPLFIPLSWSRMTVRMRTISYMRTLLVCLCLAAILVAAFTHAGTDLPAVLLAVLWIFVALAVNTPTLGAEESTAIHSSPILPVCSPRPPPIR